MVKVEVSPCSSQYKELDIPSPRVVGGLELSDTLGVTSEVTHSSSHESHNAGESGLTARRDLFCHDGQQGGEERETQQLCCISSYVHTLYLSTEDLGGSSVSKECPNTINKATWQSQQLTHSAHVLSTPWHHLHPPSVLSYQPCRTYYSDG